jgi:hypothetical protein
MKKVIVAILLLVLFATPSHALTWLEKIAYREVLVKSQNQRLLVGRVTGEVKYLWQRPTPVQFTGSALPEPGEWIPITDENVKNMWQGIYDKERSPKDESSCNNE